MKEIIVIRTIKNRNNVLVGVTGLFVKGTVVDFQVYSKYLDGLVLAFRLVG